MDAYLSRESYQAFQALNLLSRRLNTAGLLLGHKRGHRYIVERVLPIPGRLLISPEKYFGLNKILGGKIIGFFAARANEQKTRRIFAPHTYGKLFLEIKFSSQTQIKVKPYVVDYAQDFFLKPIRLKT